MSKKTATRAKKKDINCRFKTIPYISANITSKSYCYSSSFLLPRSIVIVPVTYRLIKKRERKRETTTREGWTSIFAMFAKDRARDCFERTRRSVDRKLS